MEVQERHGETTVIVDTPRLVEAALHLRDELGFNYLSDVAATDYLGWGAKGVSGYIGTPRGRDLNEPATQGFQRLPQPKPHRFSVKPDGGQLFISGAGMDAVVVVYLYQTEIAETLLAGRAPGAMASAPAISAQAKDQSSVMITSTTPPGREPPTLTKYTAAALSVPCRKASGST